MIILIQFEYNIKEKWIIHGYSIFSPITVIKILKLCQGEWLHQISNLSLTSSHLCVSWLSQDTPSSLFTYYHRRHPGNLVIPDYLSPFLPSFAMDGQTTMHDLAHAPIVPSSSSWLGNQTFAHPAYKFPHLHLQSNRSSVQQNLTLINLLNYFSAACKTRLNCEKKSLLIDKGKIYLV